MNAKLNAQHGFAHDCKDNIKQEHIKEEDSSNTDSTGQIKEEPHSGICTKKEGEENTDVSVFIYSIFLI